MSNTPTLEADLRAIEALNQQDVDAALAGDIDTITSQWTEDFVVLPSGGPIVRGRAANAAIVENGRAQLQAIDPLEYVVHFEEIRVAGDYAFEWGTYRGSMRPRAGGETVSYSGKLMRILHRQPDGSWKMHRTMTTTDPPAPAAG
jgi:ketosteroid isomerase-like protein